MAFVGDGRWIGKGKRLKIWARISHHEFIIIAIPPFTEDLVRKRQRPRGHFMPVDVFGTPVYAGSAPRNQVTRKDQDGFVCRTQDVDDLRFPPSAFSVALDALGWVG